MLVFAREVCHATDGPPKMPRTICGKLCCYGWSPGPSTAAIDGPPGPSVALQVVPRCHKWFPLNYPWK